MNIFCRKFNQIYFTIEWCQNIKLFSRRILLLVQCALEDMFLVYALHLSFHSFTRSHTNDSDSNCRKGRSYYILEKGNSQDHFTIDKSKEMKSSLQFGRRKIFGTNRLIDFIWVTAAVQCHIPHKVYEMMASPLILFSIRKRFFNNSYFLHEQTIFRRLRTFITLFHRDCSSHSLCLSSPQFCLRFHSLPSLYSFFCSFVICSNHTHSQFSLRFLFSRILFHLLLFLFVVLRPAPPTSNNQLAIDGKLYYLLRTTLYAVRLEVL